MQSLESPRSSSRSLTLVLALALLAGACSDPVSRTLTPDDARFGKVPAGTPAVSAASPASAPQDTTLDVSVTGSGFDRGSKAEWALAGVVNPAKVRTNATSYVSATELRANITIALDAVQASYDIVVTTSTGKKGVGTELFAIHGKQTVDPGIAPSGTLDAPASMIQGVNSLGAMVGNVAETAQALRRAFVVVPGSTTPIILPVPDGFRGDAWEIAENGLIAGSCGGACLWRPAGTNTWSFEVIAVPAGYDTKGFMPRLNRQGTMGARAMNWTATGDPVPVLWDLTTTPATLQRLTVIPGMIRGMGEAVNDAGVVVGNLTQSTGIATAFVWLQPSAAPVLLPAYPGSSSQMVTDINDAGDIVGWTHIPVNKTTTLTYLVLWKPSAGGTYDTPPTIISPAGAANPELDEAGDILYQYTSSNTTAYLWRPSGTTLKMAPIAGAGASPGRDVVVLQTGAIRIVGYTYVTSTGNTLAVPTIWTIP